LAIQQVTEEVVLKLAAAAKELTGSDNLCMAGGVALNCVANGKLLQQKIFKNVWIQPASGDAGGALGAALAVRYIWKGHERIVDHPDSMNGSYLGPEFDDKVILRMAGRYGAPYAHHHDFGDLCRDVAGFLSQGSVVGWFQGRMEYGPRALGNRSILGDARRPDMQKRLNLKTKHREGFRPFAPAVLAEDAGQYFDLEVPSPYMLLVAPVKDERRCPLPDGYEEIPMLERLYYPRSDIPAVTHIDFSARIQTVHKETNERLWQLVDAFKGETGCGILINTSFNLRGEPIVCSPEDAYRCFMRTEMDYLIVGDFVFEKKRQPPWTDDGDWRQEYDPD
jgi:carbamoyltransferase